MDGLPENLTYTAQNAPGFPEKESEITIGIAAVGLLSSALYLLLRQQGYRGQVNAGHRACTVKTGLEETKTNSPFRLEKDYLAHTDSEITRKTLVLANDPSDKPVVIMLHSLHPESGMHAAKHYADKHGSKLHWTMNACGFRANPFGGKRDYNLVAYLDAADENALNYTYGKLADVLFANFNAGDIPEKTEENKDDCSFLTEHARKAEHACLATRRALQDRKDYLLVINNFTLTSSPDLAPYLPGTRSRGDHADILVVADLRNGEVTLPDRQTAREHSLAYAKKLNELPCVLRHLPVYALKKPPKEENISGIAGLYASAAKLWEAPQKDYSGIPDATVEARRLLQERGYSLPDDQQKNQKDIADLLEQTQYDRLALQDAASTLAASGLEIEQYVNTIKEWPKGQWQRMPPNAYSENVETIDAMLKRHDPDAPIAEREDLPAVLERDDAARYRQAFEQARFCGYGNESEYVKEVKQRQSCDGIQGRESARAHRNRLLVTAPKLAERCTDADDRAYFTEAYADLRLGRFYSLPDREGIIPRWRKLDIWPDSGLFRPPVPAETVLKMFESDYTPDDPLAVIPEQDDEATPQQQIRTERVKEAVKIPEYYIEAYSSTLAAMSAVYGNTPWPTAEDALSMCADVKKAHQKMLNAKYYIRAGVAEEEYDEPPVSAFRGRDGANEEGMIDAALGEALLRRQSATSSKQKGGADAPSLCGATADDMYFAALDYMALNEKIRNKEYENTAPRGGNAPFHLALAGTLHGFKERFLPYFTPAQEERLTDIFLESDMTRAEHYFRRYLQQRVFRGEDEPLEAVAAANEGHRKWVSELSARQKAERAVFRCLSVQPPCR